MELQPHQQRVVDEKLELDEKIMKLANFKQIETFAKLPQEDRDLLHWQLVAMEEYSDLLGKRIARF